MTHYHVTPHVMPLNPANRLGLAYRLEAARLSWHSRIIDVHVHLRGREAARLFLEVAELFGVGEVWSQTPLEEVDAVRDVLGERVHFIAIPDYMSPDRENAFSADWLRRIEAFAARGARIAKFWAAPRGRDLHPYFGLEHPRRLEAMRLACSLGMMFMTHVADPDTWFATHYRDARRYGAKPQQYEPLERMLDRFHDVPWLAAHMGGDPEHLDHLQELLDRHPNLYLDTSATKWMVRELSKQPEQLRDFCRRNAGRVLFGSDIVANPAEMGFDLFASRYWALRTLFETDYHGPSPIVDPDLTLVDPSLPAETTAMMHGCALDPATLAVLYHGAAERLQERARLR